MEHFSSHKSSQIAVSQQVSQKLLWRLLYSSQAYLRIVHINIILYGVLCSALGLQEMGIVGEVVRR